MFNHTELPADLARQRVIGAAEAAAFLNISLPHFRRQYRLGRVPAPIRLTERKLGWRVGTLVDFLNAASKMEAV
ncbi:helix-turn-helix transcriptional regulator [Aureimonas leprariae]|uniref:Uncharacterized protein n=1 Tax=Plantimonas leprariae TaxID=2615207 RepID=A0A7V7PPW9_9HYPH|nr:hypothetical protein [Aureimonas leprariae]KAB0680153.1 hypothetical protein F6X38_08155 [Aureimonas leprariae]